ncbi:unnamed protein product [Parajaminaea phylloscopi]
MPAIEGISRRTYGASSRGCAANAASSTDTPFTPAEELSSWLPDEFCIACGAPAGTRKLYCSDKCRDDEQQGVQNTVGLSSAFDVKELAEEASYFTADAAAATALSPKAAGPVLFRYPCPPSPNLIAQRKTLNNGNEHSPVTVFDRSPSAMRSQPSGFSKAGVSSTAEDATARRRRGSSDSSNCSTDSSSAVLTDPSTPSPAFRPSSVSGRKLSDDEDVDEDLEGNAFRLPPSLVSAPPVVMRHHTHQSHMHSRRTPSLSGASGPPNRHPSTHYPTMSYARRPSSTNVPAPVLFSPALCTKAAKASPVLQADRARASMTPLRQPLWRSGREDGEARKHAASSHELNRILNASEDKAASPGGPTDIPAPGPARASSGSMSRSRSDPTPRAANSHHSSGSSSGTRTLIPARSPVAASSSSKSLKSSLCGRPGCSGPSSRQRDLTPTSVDRPMSTVPMSAPKPADGSLVRQRHRHTHSALAGVNLPQNFDAAVANGLVMTPARRLSTAGQLQETARVDTASSSSGCSDREEARDERSQALPAVATSRGRSHARGRRSVSKRSRSPPRAAARGRSQALHLEEAARKKTSDASPPLEAVKPRSQPIDITARGSSCSRTSSTGSSGSELAEYLVDDDEEHCDLKSDRRGRSPRGRQQQRRSGRSGALVEMPHLQSAVSCRASEIAEWEECDGRRGRGRDRDRDLYDGGSLNHHAPAVDPGFDVVEDLDIEV